MGRQTILHELIDGINFRARVVADEGQRLSFHLDFDQPGVHFDLIPNSFIGHLRFVDGWPIDEFAIHPELLRAQSTLENYDFFFVRYWYYCQVVSVCLARDPDVLPYLPSIDLDWYELEEFDFDTSDSLRFCQAKHKLPGCSANINNLYS